MIVSCLDLEGVLLPEIWINVAVKTGVEELKLTTRDIKDYDQLMDHRIKILKEKNISMTDIKNVINTLSPLEGAIDFINKLRQNFQVIILSDTFYQFAMPLMKDLGYPTLFCHNLIIDENDFISGYQLRIKDSKRQAVKRLKEINFKTIASGDSYNDTTMLEEADQGILFCPPDNVIKDFPHFPVANDYDTLLAAFNKAKSQLS